MLIYHYKLLGFILRLILLLLFYLFKFFREILLSLDPGIFREILLLFPVLGAPGIGSLILVLLLILGLFRLDKLIKLSLLFPVLKFYGFN